jgi:predicted phosphodiesterase
VRVILLSDIHGNLPALEAVAESLPEHDRVIVAGDLCLEGPKPAEVVDLLQELGWELLMGNTDRDIVSPPQMKERKRDIVRWTRDQLGPERVRDLGALPFSRFVIEGGAQLAMVVHANPLTMDDHLYPTMSEAELEPYLEPLEAEVLAFGHLHIPYVRPVNGRLLVDVSSVGHPKDLDARAAYTLVEWEAGRRSVTQVRVPYDVDRTVYLMRHGGMPHAEHEVESLLKASY